MVIGGGVYFYKNKKVEAPVVVNESENVGLDNQQEVAPIDTTNPNQKTMSVKLYFPNRTFNPEIFDCSLVYSVNRVIPYTQAVAAATLAELIKGPTAEEQKNGYFGTIPEGTKVNSIKIVNGFLFVDFNKEAESGGGSCGQAAKGSSIVKTLTQFSTVKSIQMSVEGNSNPSEIFQP